MQPGLNRAIPMGFLGFLLGALVVVVIRGLQGMTPLWDTGVGMTLAAFTTAGFFVWGMGAFDPAMSAHGEAAEAAHEEPDLDKAPPPRILIGSTWQLAALLLVFLVLIFGFATIPGGLKLTTTVQPGASVAMSGLVDMQIGSIEIHQVSQLVIFAVFIIITFLSLVAAAGAIGWVMTFLATGVKTVQVTARSGAESAVEAAPAGAGTPALVRRLLTAALFIVVFVILYLVFYYVAIGLIAPKPDVPGLNIIFPDPANQLIVLSFVNAVIFTVLILRPSVLLRFIGQVARVVLSILHHVPSIFQRRS